jgi:23S rRNA (uracil1939-C5)-methyltransferase
LLLKDDLNDALRILKPGSEATLRSGRNGLNPPLEEELDGLVFKISGFFQVNADAALLLYKKAREYAALSQNETMIDLYCGVGALTLFIGRDAGYAMGVEQNRASVKAARDNARRNNLAHINFICADAAEWECDISKTDCVIVDPPRKGLSPGAARKIIELSPKRIVYISCDPATLARDIRVLEGYTVKDVCAVDMFPRTANVECCCLLSLS